LWSIFFSTGTGDKDTLIADLWERGTCGIVEEADGLRAFFEDTVSAAEIAAAFGGNPSTVRPEEPIDPAHFQQDDWEPVLAGERFYIAPPWISTPAPAGRFRLEINASTAFGTGRHETTQLCIQALEKHLKHGDAVFDVGCGSGILLAAAGLLGAGQMVGCDIDFDALTVARLHVRAPLFIGSADAVCESTADVTIANITPRVLDRIASELKRVTKPGGLVIISGFIRENQPKRFVFEEMLEQGDWQCWVCRPEHINASALGELAEPGSHPERWWI